MSDAEPSLSTPNDPMVTDNEAITQAAQDSIPKEDHPMDTEDNNAIDPSSRPSSGDQHSQLLAPFLLHSQRQTIRHLETSKPTQIFDDDIPHLQDQFDDISKSWYNDYFVTDVKFQHVCQRGKST